MHQARRAPGEENYILMIWTTANYPQLSCAFCAVAQLRAASVNDSHINTPDSDKCRHVCVRWASWPSVVVFSARQVVRKRFGPATKCVYLGVR